ncbi:hypothetical protein FGW20_13220 [Methanoculleus sp. FWC-SCC3]|jgi:hypothetical protein|uniref:Lipoprotein n=1 Tax=Methanoculleus methanifontis TaxID=2584086 RepID=A0ABT8M5T4_9EURY|nr:hypothetical protein [Methanoculleus sp. FWC-SCC3]MDN7013959.1 hypothetical protein [Methanoculleus sp. FWC-SCC3]
MLGKKVWVVSLTVLTIIFIAVTGCTDSGNGGWFGEEKFVYDEDFSLTGEISKKEGKGIFWEGYYTYKLKTENLIINLPSDGGKLYQIYVTTYDPESKVRLTGGGNYTYKYKTDKFGNYSIETGNFKDPFSFSGAYADKLSDINTILYTVPANESSYGRIASVDGHIVNAELIDRNFYLVLEIPGPLSPSTDGNLFEDGEIVRANGHITIKETDGKVKLTKGMLGDNRVTVIEIDGEETSRRADAMG